MDNRLKESEDKQWTIFFEGKTYSKYAFVEKFGKRFPEQTEKFKEELRNE